MSQDWPITIPISLSHRLDQCGFSHPEELLLLDDIELATILGLSRSTCRKVLLAVAQSYLPDNSKTGLTHELGCGTGIELLDKAFHGGIRPGWLVEIYGTAGAGKTQACFTLAAQALADGRTVYWIDTENSFRPERLLELAGESELSKLMVSRCFSLIDVVEKMSVISTLVSATMPPVIIVDSIASAVKDIDVAERRRRLHDFIIMSKNMHAVVVCTNHVVADLHSDTPNSSKPALGDTWSHGITCRLRIEKTGDHKCCGRSIEILKSPTCGYTSIHLSLTNRGLIAENCYYSRMCLP